VPTITVYGYVFREDDGQGIPGSRVEFSVKIDGRWIPSGSMVVGQDGYFIFTYPGLVQAIALFEINADGYSSVRAVPIDGGSTADADHMEQANLPAGTYGPYNFYDLSLEQGTDPSCGCVSFVVFHSNRDGNWELYRLTPGTDAAPTNLTNNPATDMAPAIAPNGIIAFQSNRDGNWEIYTVNSHGQRLTRVTNNPADDTDPVWSPDCSNRRLAFQSNRDGHWEIYVSSGAPNAERRLTHSAGDSVNPAWSPSGQFLAYLSNRDGDWELYTMNVDTGEERRLTDNSVRVNNVVPTPTVVSKVAPTPTVAPKASPTAVVAPKVSPVSTPTPKK
jgi:hypothetical protein